MLLVPVAAGAFWLGHRWSSAHDAHDAQGGAVAAAPANEPDPAVDAATADDAHAGCRAENDALRSRVLRLEAQLADLQVESVAREEEWLAYNRMISSIAPEDVFPELAIRRVQEEMADAEPPPPDPAQVALEERSAAMKRSLVALFRADGIDRYDVLELGLLSVDESGQGAIGPVLLRSFDDRGRALGTLTAERLRLEGSRAGRTLTLVLEDGYTRQFGARTPFPGADEGAERGGVFRLLLPHTDPRPWADALPELFREDPTYEITDDGRWNLLLLRRDLNARLDRAALGGRYVLKDCAGVTGDVWHDVAFDELGENGELRRRLFADRLRVHVDESGVRLELREGVAVRGAQKLPFLDGRMRIYLPRAPISEWTDGSLPVVDARPADAPIADDASADGAVDSAAEDASADDESAVDPASADDETVADPANADEDALPAGSDAAGPR